MQNQARIVSCLGGLLMAATLSLHAAAPPSPSFMVDPTYTLVQTAQSGNFGKDEHGDYVLILKDVSAQTIGFADRTDLDAGSVSTEKFLKMMTFDKKTPPVAAVVLAQGAKEDQDTILVELTEPEYDEGSQVLRYHVRLLDKLPPTLQPWSTRADASLPGKFGGVSLFFRGCPGTYPLCYGDVRCQGQNCCPVVCGSYPSEVGRCWSWKNGCHICHPETVLDYCNSNFCEGNAGSNTYCRTPCSLNSPC